MKTLVSTLLATIAVALLAVAPSALAQTPDGETPANEGVCNDLRGLTPGLYGLCVAFCEAQDHASILDPITEEELDALEGASPSGRILANYNKKKKAGDPDMPCIKVAEPCLCWSSEELANRDGIMPSGNPGRLQCRDRAFSPFFSDTLIIEGRGPSIALERAYARTFCSSGFGSQSQCSTAAGTNVVRACQFDNFQGPRRIFRQFTVPSTLTFEQYEACQAQVREANASRCTIPFPTL